MPNLSDAPLDGLKVEYPKRKSLPESEDKELNQFFSDLHESLAKSQKPQEFHLSEEELFDCYAKSPTE